jgi:hypothetical protein
MDCIAGRKNKWKYSEAECYTATDKLEGEHNTFSFCATFRHNGTDRLKNLGNLSYCGEKRKMNGCSIQHNCELRQKCRPWSGECAKNLPNNSRHYRYPKDLLEPSVSSLPCHLVYL